MRRAIVVTVLMLPLISTVALAADLSRSRVEVPASAQEGEVVRFAIHLLNSGETGSVQLTFRLPFWTLQVDARGLEGAAFSPDDHTWRWDGALAAGEERTGEVDLLVRDGGAGLPLTGSVGIHVADVDEQYLDVVGPEVNRRPTIGGIQFGGLVLTPAAVAVVSFLVGVMVATAVLVVILAVRRRTLRGVVVVAVAIMTVLTIPLGLLTYFAVMLRQDLRALNDWTETSCTVLDQTVRSSSQSSTGGRRYGSSTTTTQMPVLALRYSVGDRNVIAAGFGTDSRLSFKRRALDQVFANYSIGSHHPCWYDPDEPTRVVVERGFGGTYLFALFPLPILLAGLFALSRALAVGKTDQTDGRNGRNGRNGAAGVLSTLFSVFSVSLW